MQHQLNDITIRIFKYLSGQFEDLDKRFEKHDAHIDGLYNLLDAYLKQVETNHQEALAGDARVLRLEEQVRRLARAAQNQQKVSSR